MATVLIVDDEPVILSSLSALLELHGHQVVTASNGFEALRASAARTPDVVVSDWEMPFLDGASLYGTFRADPRLRMVPFIFMSGTADSREIPTADFFQKPFSPTDVIQAIARLLSYRQGFGE
ncbi:response regulator [Caballeronia sp. LZ062]|uniref:response regulator n=1 Tax=unclassified Caballeronia TaxID=2646786 RepID=UPI0028597AD5|nr:MULTISPECIES: response regulator [unclassified Caballeronia]MDR5855721.1 response regulator [Caballeronia sp. LZ050]MDR5872492.1 response regulator [Caballeronia sp. LZ062]